MLDVFDCSTLIVRAVNDVFKTRCCLKEELFRRMVWPILLPE